MAFADQASFWQVNHQLYQCYAMYVVVDDEIFTLVCSSTSGLWSPVDKLIFTLLAWMDKSNFQKNINIYSHPQVDFHLTSYIRDYSVCNDLNYAMNL